MVIVAVLNGAVVVIGIAAHIPNLVPNVSDRTLLR
jgi:hypothetical protein